MKRVGCIKVSFEKLKGDYQLSLPPPLLSFPPLRSPPPPLLRSPLSSLGRASFTLSARPSSSWPSSCSIAALPSASSDISTKPKPFDLPVSLSSMIAALVTVPNCSKASWSCWFESWYERFPTYMFIIFLVMCTDSVFFTNKPVAQTYRYLRPVWRICIVHYLILTGTQLE